MHCNKLKKKGCNNTFGKDYQKRNSEIYKINVGLIRNQATKISKHFAHFKKNYVWWPDLKHVEIR